MGRVYGKEKSRSRRKIGPKAGRQERLLKEKGPSRPGLYQIEGDKGKKRGRLSKFGQTTTLCLLNFL
jgi:hypothetical protein